MSHKCFTAIFSASEQTHSALVVCDSEWLTVVSHNSLWKLTEVVTALFGCYMAGSKWNCCRLGARSVYNLQPCASLQCHFIWSHIHRVQVCLAVTCHLHCWQNDQDILHATEVAQKVDPGEENSPTAHARDSNPRLFNHEPGALPLSYSFWKIRSGRRRQSTLKDSDPHQQV